MHWLFYFILALVLLVGLYINLIGAPGLWMMVLATLVFSLLTHFQEAGLRTLIAITVLAGIAELIEFLSSSVTAKRAGATKRGVWGAIIGGIVGGIFLTALIPIPIVGTIFGICLGTFLGAILGETWGGTAVGQSLRVGLGATKGRLIGMFTKLLFGLAIFATVLITAKPRGWPWSHQAAPSGHAIVPATVKA